MSEILLGAGWLVLFLLVMLILTVSVKTEHKLTADNQLDHDDRIQTLRDQMKVLEEATESLRHACLVKKAAIALLQAMDGPGETFTARERLRELLKQGT